MIIGLNFDWILLPLLEKDLRPASTTFLFLYRFWSSSVASPNVFSPVLSHFDTYAVAEMLPMSNQNRSYNTVKPIHFCVVSREEVQVVFAAKLTTLTALIFVNFLSEK